MKESIQICLTIGQVRASILLLPTKELHDLAQEAVHGHAMLPLPVESLC